MHVIITSKLSHCYTVPMNKTNNNNHIINQLYNMQLQKEVKSNPKTAQL